MNESRIRRLERAVLLPAVNAEAQRRGLDPDEVLAMALRIDRECARDGLTFEQGEYREVERIAVVTGTPTAEVAEEWAAIDAKWASDSGQL